MCVVSVFRMSATSFFVVGDKKKEFWFEYFKYELKDLGGFEIFLARFFETVRSSVNFHCQYSGLYYGLIFQVATRGTSPDVTTVFHAWVYGRFIQIQSNLRRKKLHRTNQGSNFLGSSFSNRDNV